MQWIDHIAVGVPSLEAGVAEFMGYGLGAVEGGRHPEGTMNRNIPLDPPQYVELIEVWDPEGDMGRRTVELMEAGQRLLGVAIEVDDIDAVGRRVGVCPDGGSIQLPDGTTGTWGYVEHPSEHWLPFYISYGMGHAARQARIDRWAARYQSAEHHNPPSGIRWVEIGGNAQLLRSWLGETSLPIKSVPGPPGIRRFGVGMGDREVVIS